jgi:carbamoyltransferase
LDETVKRLCAGEFGGWFEGGSELGPRALGHRSILADPRHGDAKSMLNSRIKFRESFRPFAPAVLKEKAAEWFELDGVDPDSPFMLRVCPLKPGVRDLVPAVVHVDGSGRLQTVSEEHGGKFYALLRRFYDVTGVPLLLNTSFNGVEEPIVETPEDALWCMLQNDLDFVVLEDRMIVREDGLHSILDLFPVIVADSYSVEVPIEEGRFSSDVPGTVVLKFSLKTRWGVKSVPVYGYLTSLMGLIDGQTNGWTLKERLSNSLAIDVDKNTFRHALGALKRASVITFQKTPRTDEPGLDTVRTTSR